MILSHPTGNANVRAAALGIKEAGLLTEFRTSIASFQGTVLDNLGSVGPLSEIRRRRYDNSLRSLTHTWPWAEAGRILASKMGLTNLIKHETGLFCIDAVYQNFDKNVALSLKKDKGGEVKAVYAYEDGALFSFQEAQSLNIKCFYDLPIGYWREALRLLEQERLLKPEWASTLTSFLDSDQKLARKDEELQLADHIFVASQFTADTLKKFPGKLAPIEVIPYGFPPIAANREFSSASNRKCLRILFVGGLSQRKGIAQLFEAVEAIGSAHVTLTIVGQKISNNCEALNVALAKHLWIPSLPHDKVLELMQAHDVLVFPSLFEGFGLVITEAMSQGTPVITTERTAGPDLIDHDRNGWIVEAGSTQALQMAIENLICYPEVIPKAGKEAMETARDRPWNVYGRELAEAINRISK